MKMKVLILLILLCFPQTIQQQQLEQREVKLQYANGRPTTFGIDTYVNSSVNQKNFIREYQKMIHDSLYNDIYFRTETPKQKTSILAYNVLSNSGCEVIVYNAEKYRAFEYDTAKYMLYTDYDYFLKATVFHEISHYYFYQCILEMQRIKHITVNPYYTADIYLYPNRELQYGAKFIEEGFCEYVVQRFNVCPEFINVRIPQYKTDFEDKTADFDIQYVFASKYLWNFLDMSIGLTGSVKDGLMVILSNRPPNYEEMLKPALYFERLKLELPTDSI